MRTYVEAVPAYGRSYTTLKATKEAWEQGKDFRDSATGVYLNKQDAENHDIAVNVRYGKNLEKVGTLRK